MNERSNLALISVATIGKLIKHKLGPDSPLVEDLSAFLPRSF